ncbi:rCG58790, partial [Rattus norvegicus]
MVETSNWMSVNKPSDTLLHPDPWCADNGVCTHIH